MDLNLDLRIEENGLKEMETSNIFIFKIYSKEN